MATLYYAVTCGEALHIIPAESHEVTEDRSLVVHGRENHTYGPLDWDAVVWEGNRDALESRLKRTVLNPRLSD